MWYYILGTTVILPFYLLIRWPYFKLPLGPDVGFYVSNNTIINKKISFSKGWNAHYAACSKLITEYFYSLIYLWFGKENYKFASRLGFSLYNYITAILVGLLLHQIAGGTFFVYIVGLVLYCLISSEPHYGVYFESGDQFESLFQTLGLLLILIGVKIANPYFIVGGVLAWFLDGVLIKLSGLIAAVVVFWGVVFLDWSTFLILIAVASLSLLIYIYILCKSKVDFFTFLKPVLRHEISFCKRISKEKNMPPSLSPFARFLQKSRQTLRIVIANPIIPMLAIGGVILGIRDLEFGYLVIMLICALALFIKFIMSFTPIWYYNAPLLPLVAIFASISTIALIKSFPWGIVTATILLISWIFWNVIRVYQKDIRFLNRYVWKIQTLNGGEHNYILDVISGDIKGIVGNKLLFIYGHTIQPYLLIGASYDVPFPSVIGDLTIMEEDLYPKLHFKMLKEPPEYIFDEFNTCDTDAIKKNLGLEYVLIKTWYNTFRLYKYVGCHVMSNFNINFDSLIYENDKK